MIMKDLHKETILDRKQAEAASGRFWDWLNSEAPNHRSSFSTDLQSQMDPWHNSGSRFFSPTWRREVAHGLRWLQVLKHLTYRSTIIPTFLSWMIIGSYIYMSDLDLASLCVCDFILTLNLITHSSGLQQSCRNTKECTWMYPRLQAI